ncbi:MAG: 16S rRNA (cytidine(1402)-2'-O)-methyltransferase [Deltaproteobacteria bacterium]|jgi:16S rRNA (cytidine1402-2'-O)-methyltransferase|nr:16S rRNA (cytidine(1402)-2'-O)-methyltransferase [Deltaproteobacteria bacterium]
MREKDSKGFPEKHSPENKQEGRSPIEPGLYVIPSPLGNLDDLSLRQTNALASSSLIAAEDTRRSLKLLSFLKLRVPVLSYREQNHDAVWPKIKTVLDEGGTVSLLSDAGTPSIADPGAELVTLSRARGFRVVPLPGPSAVTTALAASGFKAESFTFGGFLPAKRGKRTARVESFKELRHPLIFFEVPHRLAESLADLLSVLGPRMTLLAREMTKKHEEYALLPLDLLLKDAEANPRKGEITLVIEGAGKDKSPASPDFDGQNPPDERPGDSKDDPEAAGTALRKNKGEITSDPRPLKVLAKEWEGISGFSKKTLYALFSSWRREK